MGKWIIAAAIVAALGLFQWNSGRTERAFAAMVKDINRRAPFNVTPLVRMDKAELKGKEVSMQVTLTDENPDTPKLQQQLTTNLLKDTFIKKWCSPGVIRDAIDKGFALTTAAKRTDGSELVHFSVNREECICFEQHAQGRDLCVIRY